MKKDGVGKVFWDFGAVIAQTNPSFMIVEVFLRQITVYILSMEFRLYGFRHLGFSKMGGLWTKAERENGYKHCSFVVGSINKMEILSEHKGVDDLEEMR